MRFQGGKTVAIRRNRVYFSGNLRWEKLKKLTLLRGEKKKSLPLIGRK